MQFWAGAFTVTINARILNRPVMRYLRYLLKRTHRVLWPADEPVENRNQINNLAHSGSSHLTDSGYSLGISAPCEDISLSQDANYSPINSLYGVRFKIVLAASSY